MFYVYEHIRPDTGAIFYVGKGSGYRNNSTCDRNRHWQFIVKKANGFSSKILFSHENEELVLLAEEERIDQLKRLSVKLCNMTKGGEGLSGFSHSQETKVKLREIALNRPKRKLSEAHKEALRKANLGVVFTEERKEKIRQKALNRKHHPNTLKALVEARKNFKHSAETIKRMCEIQKNMPKTKCLHCSFVGNAGNLSRWHNNNCKLKGESNG
jgi:hypothetical protein